MDLSTHILVLLLLITSVVIGIGVYFVSICLIFKCESPSGDYKKLPLDGFVVPFKQRKLVNFIKLFFSLTNPYVYILVSLIVGSVLIVTTLKTKKISKQVNASDLYKNNEES